jgi:3-hydroxybutyrate dehydrogenase
MSTRNHDLRGKVALVTGAASGLGKEIAMTFAKSGASVAIADLNREGAETVAAELRAAGHEAMAVQMDVTDEAAVNDGVDHVSARFGSVDILVSNAGVQIVNPIETFSFADWRKSVSDH